MNEIMDAESIARKINALHGLQYGNWLLDLDVDSLALQHTAEGNHVQYLGLVGTFSEDLAKAARDLAALAEKVKAAGY